MNKSIVLFDVDGTLTEPRKKVSQDMLYFLEELSEYIDIGIVGGSDLTKIKEQLGDDLLDYKFVKYVFSENGLVAHYNGELIAKSSLSDFLGEPRLKEFINFCLRYIADLDLPVKRGTFIEYRSGMLNVSPIGRNCSYEERVEFEKYDQVHKVREKMIAALKEVFGHYGLVYSIGGMISFDVFPKGWDKTYCLQFVKEYNGVYFFGDKTHEGGNDYEIYTSPIVVGNKTLSPEDTMLQCRCLFM